MARVASLAAVTVLGLGTLSGTAAAQEIRHELLTHYYSTGAVPHVSGGDADVYSKTGRFTDVAVYTHGPHIVPGGGSLNIGVEYVVQEGRSNYTRLRKLEWVTLYAPQGWRIASVLPTRSPVYWSRRYYGEDHFWHDELQAGTHFAYFSTRFDGSGRDDRGNAGLVAQIEIPVELVRN
jgi:hypothetical protein